MSDTVIKVENLGKKYIIGHQKPQNYTALRDVIAHGVKSLGQKLLQPLGKKTADPAVEEFWALKDVSFEIKQGDRVGIIGRNGAGKSTLLKILSRIVEPTKGRIAINGRVASLLEVGTGFHPELTGRENIYLNGAILGMGKTEIKQKFDEIVEFAEVEKFLDTPVKRYSSGMYVRLAFAVAAHLEPEILIVDEVLAVGDAAFQKKCLGKMGDVANQQGRTVLFVSHNMASIQRLCSRAILLNDGNISLDGEVDAAIEKYSAIVDPDTNNQFDLLSYPRNASQYTGVIFSKCLILNSLGNVNSNLRLGEPFSVHLEVIAETSYEDLSLVVGIDSADQTRITTAISSDFGKHFSVAPHRLLQVNVTFDQIVLYPGNYFVSIAIRSGRRSLDTLMYINKFQVSLLTYGDTLIHNNSAGMVKTQAQWIEVSQTYSQPNVLSSNDYSRN